jgi:pyruvate-ferredoxin/flavodoxin oxidoreductase
MLSFSQPERARQLARQAQQEMDRRWAVYRALAAPAPTGDPSDDASQG